MTISPGNPMARSALVAGAAGGIELRMAEFSSDETRRSIDSMLDAHLRDPGRSERDCFAAPASSVGPRASRDYQPTVVIGICPVESRATVAFVREASVPPTSAVGSALLMEVWMLGRTREVERNCG